MNPKIANLIAIEIGILIGLMSWLTYSRFPSSEPRAEAGMQENMMAPGRAVAPAFEASNQRPSTGDYNAEREQARLMAERSASLQSYYRASARESGTTSDLENGSAVVDSPTYAEVNPQPAALADEYVAPPPTVFYYAPAAVQNVVFANPHRFRDRCRSTPQPGPVRTNTHQCPERRNPHVSDTRVVAGPHVSAPPRPPVQGPRPREAVSQTVVTGGEQQKRVTFSASSGTARRLVP